MTHEWSTTISTHLLVEGRCRRCQLRRWRAPAGEWRYGVGDGRWDREEPACTNGLKAGDEGEPGARAPDEDDRVTEPKPDIELEDFSKLMPFTAAAIRGLVGQPNDVLGAVEGAKRVLGGTFVSVETETDPRPSQESDAD